MDCDKTIQTRQAFDRIAASHNVSVRYYHCDTGLFDTNIFKKKIARSNQTVVNAHHQNGNTEHVIRDSTDGVRNPFFV